MVSLMLHIMKLVVQSKLKSKTVIEKQVNPVSELTPPGQRCGQLGRVAPQQYVFTPEAFKESVCMFINAILKSKFAKYKQMFDETLISLFLHRSKSLYLAQMLELKACEVNYLESKDLLDHVLEAPSRCPTMFLNSVQSYFGFEFTWDFSRAYRQDNLLITLKS